MADDKKCAKCQRPATVIVGGVHLCSRCAVDSLEEKDDEQNRAATPR
jgi:hypothetical protein